MSEEIYTATRKYRENDIVIGQLDRPKAYDSRRYLWIKKYTEDKTMYELEKIEVEPNSICLLNEK
jgi:hypothetical protein